jgi:prevent-host-death family protein
MPGLLAQDDRWTAHCMLVQEPILAETQPWGITMQTLTAKEAKNAFGRLIDLARAEPVTVAKHGRPVVVVMAAEEFARLTVAARHQPIKQEQDAH